MRKSLLFVAAGLFGFALAGLGTGVQTANAAFDAQLGKGDCEKCHRTIVVQVDEAGNKHKTAVECLDCHDTQHPPGIEKRSMIPQCSKCHEGEPHFSLQNCLACHNNPHQPLNITFGDNVKAACSTCHPEVVAEIDANLSAHQQVDCSFCHDKHGYKPDCLNCHEPHREDQKFDDCVRCHQVHQPLTLAYGDNVPNQDCGACHGDVRNGLESGSTKHAGFNCVFCHAEKHAVVPQCQDCHGTPHNAKMLSMFTGCIQCHQSAHNLLK